MCQPSKFLPTRPHQLSGAAGVYILLETIAQSLSKVGPHGQREQLRFPLSSHLLAGITHALCALKGRV